MTKDTEVPAEAEPKKQRRAKKGKSLVIVESPAKAKTINKYLGKDFVVRASMGHIRDLPKGKFGIDLDHFTPEYQTIRGKGKVIGIAAAVVVVIVLGAGAFFGRSFIVDLWPGAADIYSMVGLGGEELGAGLDIRDVKSSRKVEGGVDVLVVRGVVANVTEEDRMVPMIRIALYDSAGEEVQHVIAPPLKNRLQPGATIGFSAKLPEPSALARRLEVTFSEPKKTGG